MMRNAFKCMALIICGSMPCMMLGTKVVYHTETNSLELIHELNVTPPKIDRAEQLIQNTSIFTSGDQKVRLIITAPNNICVGQPFTIYFTIQTKDRVMLPFWADLIPDSEKKCPKGVII